MEDELPPESMVEGSAVHEVARIVTERRRRYLRMKTEYRRLIKTPSHDFWCHTRPRTEAALFIEDKKRYHAYHEYGAEIPCGEKNIRGENEQIFFFRIPVIHLRYRLPAGLGIADVAVCSEPDPRRSILHRRRCAEHRFVRAAHT